MAQALQLRERERDGGREREYVRERIGEREKEREREFLLFVRTPVWAVLLCVLGSLSG